MARRWGLWGVWRGGREVPTRERSIWGGVKLWGSLYIRSDALRRGLPGGGRAVWLRVTWGLFEGSTIAKTDDTHYCSRRCT